MVKVDHFKAEHCQKYRLYEKKLEVKVVKR